MKRTSRLRSCAAFALFVCLLTVYATAAELTPFPIGPSQYDDLSHRDELVVPDVALSVDRVVDLELAYFDVFANGAEIVIGSAAGDVRMPPPEVALFRGRVAGEAASCAFLAVTRSTVQGWITSGNKTYIIATAELSETPGPVIYDLAAQPPDSFDWTPFDCQAAMPPDQLIPRQSDRDTEMSRDGTTIGCTRVNVAIDTDWEFTGNLFAGNTDDSAAYATLLIGAVAEIYRRDLDVELSISYLRLWSDSGDPWDQPEMGAQLDQFRNYWQSHMGSVPRNIAHLLSGRYLGGGVAWVGVLCGSTYRYGLSSSLAGHFPYPTRHNHNNNWDPYVVSHEIGHNFGAPHTHDMNPPIDGCGLGDCTDAYLGTIMSYCHGCPGGQANIRLEFHQRMIDEAILPYLGNVSCLGTSGITVTQQPPASQTVCAGDLVSLTIATDAVFPTYQWRRGATELVDDATLLGTQTPSLAFLGAVPDHSADDYNCVVTPAAADCSIVVGNFALAVDDYGAEIITQPQDATVNENQPFALTVGVDQPFLHSYQWRKDGVPLSDDGRVFGANTTTMLVTAAELTDGGDYDCEITALSGAHCVVTSDAAHVTVIPTGPDCPGDLNGDNLIDLSDLSQMLANYGVLSGASYEDGDIDGDGDVDLADLGALLAVYNTSCV